MLTRVCTPLLGFTARPGSTSWGDSDWSQAVTCSVHEARDSSDSWPFVTRHIQTVRKHSRRDRGDHAEDAEQGFKNLSEGPEVRCGVSAESETESWNQLIPE